MARTHLDFDATGPEGALDLVKDAWQQSSAVQQTRNNQYQRDYELYEGYIPPRFRDPDRANVFIPKIRSIVETLVPREMKALFGTRPYMPIETKRKEYQSTARIQTQMLDEYMNMAGFFEKSVVGSKMKTLSGTSFVEVLPFHEMVTEKQVVPELIFGQPTGGFNIVEVEVPRLRLKTTYYAPWDIYVDPYATGLEEKGTCRYAIKVHLTSKREIKALAEQGAYPDFDIEKLDKLSGNFGSAFSGSEQGKLWGLQMLANIGLNMQHMDEDMVVLLRYESDERYIDTLDGEHVLRDIENPFKHKRINLSRWVHNFDPHSQNQFWGMGEAKPNEILQAMYNDLMNMTLNNHQMLNQMMIYYRKGTISDVNALVRVAGNRVEVNATPDRPLRDSIHESPGQNLPSDHYRLTGMVEQFMDQTSGVFQPTRGEPSEGDQTATEAALLKETGDTRHELNIRQGETFLGDVAEKCLFHIEQYATPDDIVEVVGLEGAIGMLTLNPADLPGGFNFSFKGSSRVSNQLIKQRNWKELMGVLGGVPNVLPGWLATKVLEAYEVDQDEIDEGVIPDEIMLQIQAAQANQGQKFQENNTKQEAQKSGQAIRGAA